MPRNLDNAPDLDATLFLEMVRHSEWRGNFEVVDEPLSWRCFHCNRQVSNKGSGRRLIGTAEGNRGHHVAWLVNCSYCNMPCLLDPKNRPLFESTDIQPVPNVPEDVDKVFREALSALSVSLFSSAVLLSRKLIMHLAFELGKDHFDALTQKNRGRTPNFVEYVGWLRDNHYIPPAGGPWVNEVVERGNDENHQLITATRDEATRIVKITRLLLAFNYEFAEIADELNGDG